MSNFTPQQIEEFLREFFDVVGTRQYTGARYVPIFGRAGESTLDWDDLAPYEPLTVVMHEGVSYVSRRYVPRGIQITDTAYWCETYRFDAQVEQYRQEVLGFSARIDELAGEVSSDYVPFPDAQLHPKYGTVGQVLSSLADGTTLWQDPVVPSDAQAEAVITQWLDDHPEATTTVADNSLTTAKYRDGSVTDEKLDPDGVVADVAYIDGDLREITDGELGFRPHGLVTNIDTFDTNTQRGHTALRFTGVRLTCVVTGIPTGYTLYLYQRPTTQATIAGQGELVEDGTTFTVEAQRYWRFMLVAPSGTEAAGTRGITLRTSDGIQEAVAELDAKMGEIYETVQNLSVTEGEPLTSRGVTVTRVSPYTLMLTGTCENSTNLLIFNGQHQLPTGGTGYNKNVDAGTYYVSISTAQGETPILQWRDPTIGSDSAVSVYDGDMVTVPDACFYIRIQTNKNYGTVEDPTIVTIKLTLDSIAYDFDATAIDRKARYLIENGLKAQQYDVILFAGQSNMAGRGITDATHPEQAPASVEGSGFEFRAVSDPTKLYPIAEPFGVAENKVGGLNDGSGKTGSSVTAFVNAYFKGCGIPVIGVSASEGGTNLREWIQGYVSNTGRLYDACQRLRDCLAYCTANDIAVRRVMVVWLQGESDAQLIESGTSDYTLAEYVTNFETCQQAFMQAGAEQVLVIRIGRRAGSDGSDTGSTMYDDVIEEQTTLCQTDPDLVMVCTDLAGMRARGLMKDQSHYFQQAYNEFGTYAGINAALYNSTYKEPTMYDTYYANLYYTHKN